MEFLQSCTNVLCTVIIYIYFILKHSGLRKSQLIRKILQSYKKPQECDDRDRSITEFNLREKQLKQEIQSLYDQIDDCQVRERTYTNESFRSRLGNYYKAFQSIRQFSPAIIV